MAYNLFLDDYRMPKNAFAYTKLPIYIGVDWIVVRNYYAFVALIEGKGVPEIVSFDHDLAEGHYKQSEFDYSDNAKEKTGYHCAEWLIYHCLDNNKELPAEVLIHSMNPAGSLNIKSLFDTFCMVYKIPKREIYMLPSTTRTATT